MSIPRTHSLGTRLFILLVVPLIAVSVASTVLRYWTAQDMSQHLYDDTLRVVAHAVSREVVLTKGDLVADELLNSLVGALGDPIYYQVRAGGGRFITGHSDAPIPPASLEVTDKNPVFFNSNYQGRPVRSVLLREFIADPDFDGWTTVQIWQTVTQRQALSLSIMAQSAFMLLLVVSSAALLLWFGINRGLSPLADLREAVGVRSERDLRPIRRPVPKEVAPLVATINSLFSRLQAELDRRNVFVGNAAHQLRNPVAAIQAQAEAALSASSETERLTRLDDLVLTAGQLSRMSNQLLNYDIASETNGEEPLPPSDFAELVAGVARRHVPRALAARVDIEMDSPPHPLPVAGNIVLLQEAIDNLIDNGLKYGCPPGGRLSLRVAREDDRAILTVSDDGPGIPPEAAERIFERFVRLSEDSNGGCGLGLSIVKAIVERAGGTVSLVPAEGGCTFRVALALADAGPVRMNPAAE